MLPIRLLQPDDPALPALAILIEEMQAHLPGACPAARAHGPLFARDAVLSLWIDEFESTHAWSGVTTLVLHPQVSGRPMRWHLLRDFLRHVQEKGDVWIATGEEITNHFEALERHRGTS